MTIDSNAELADLLDVLEAGVVVWRDGAVYANATAVRLFGVASAEVLLGSSSLEALFTAPSVPALAALLGQRDTALLPSGRCEVQARHGSAVGPWLQVQARPITWQGSAAMLLTCVEIERQKQAEAALANERLIFQQVLDSLPSQVALKDAALRYTRVNAGMAQFCRAEPASLISHSNDDIPAYSRAWRAVTGDMDREVLTHGQAVRQASVVVPDDEGRPRTWRISKHPLRDADGAVVGIIGSSDDVTEHVAMESALRDQQRLLQAVIDQVPIAVAVKDLERRYLIVNRAMLDFWGLTDPETAIGKRVEELDRGSSEDRARIADMHGRVLATGATVEIPEMPFTAEDGRTLWRHLIEMPLLDDRGRIAGIIGIADDITADREAAANLREMAAALDQAGDAVFITNLNGRISYVNGAFELLTGYSRNEAIGQTPRLLKSGLQSSEFYREVWGTLLRGEIWDGRYINRRKDGTTYHTHSTISPVRDERGHISAYLAVQRNVSQQVELDARLLRTQRLEALGTLAGGIAHDFNNTLTPIMGYTELMRHKTRPGSKESDWLRVIAEASGRARELAKRILLFTRQGESQHRPMRVGRVLDEVTSLLRASLPSEVELRASVEEDVSILGSPGEMHQVLMNLCVNAAQAMPDGGTLTVTLDVKELDCLQCYLGKEITGRFAHLRVSDTGKGMDEAVLSHLFEPFFTTKPVGQGTGLGLSTVFGIVRSFGGALCVKSAPGEGTTFDVYLPTSDVASQADGPVNTVAHRGSEHVLVVDDEPAIANLARALLEEQGYQVTVCTNGPKAMALLEADPTGFDALVTDLSMPEVPGDVLAQRLRVLNSTVPIILCTGLTSGSPSEAAIRDTLSAVIYKPYNPAELSGVLRRLLDGDPPHRHVDAKVYSASNEEPRV